MPQRKKSPRSPTSPNLSGPLGEALKFHAYRRMVWLFRYLFAVKASCDYIAKRGGVVFNPLQIITAAATHQIDEGLRSDNIQHTIFDSTDANVVNISSTEFTSTDAAHFCNLGLKPDLWARLCSVAEALPGTDEAVWLFVELAETSAGDTVQLPQRINIGPDRVIDRAHFTIARDILQSGNPILSEANLTYYTAVATNYMQQYIVTKAASPGLVTCCRFYLLSYCPEACKAAFSDLSGNIWGETEATKGVLAAKDYIA